MVSSGGEGAWVWISIIPTFNREHYGFWEVKMKTWLRS